MFRHHSYWLPSCRRGHQDHHNQKNSPLINQLKLAHNTDAISYIINGLQRKLSYAWSWQLWHDSASTFMYCCVKGWGSCQVSNSKQHSDKQQRGLVPLHSGGRKTFMIQVIKVGWTYTLYWEGGVWSVCPLCYYRTHKCVVSTLSVDFHSHPYYASLRVWMWTETLSLIFRPTKQRRSLQGSESTPL